MTAETSSPYFTKEHNALRAQAKEFADRVLAPAAAQIDKAETFPQEIVDQMASLGYFGLRIPAEYGGKGLDMRSYVCVMEELAKKCATATLYVSSANSLSTAPLVLNGTEPQKRAWVPGVVDGTRKITFALTEPGAGSDAASLRTTAVPDGDDYILNGTKCFITFAPLAAHHIVYAKTEPDKGAKGITAFLVDKEMPGVIVGDHLDKMGQRGVPVSDLILQNVRVPKQRIIGEKNLGFINAMKTLSVGRIGVASMCLGLMGEALDLAVEHLKGRQQFGKTLSENQALRFTVAEMATKVKAAQELVYHAAWRMDQGENADMEASMAKLFAAETGIEVVNKALQMFGGYGYARGYEIERIYRDIRVSAIYEGSSEVQKIVIAGKIFGKTANTESKPNTPEAHPITGQRKRRMLTDGTLEQRAAQLVEALKAEGYDFSRKEPIDTPVSQADRLVSAGRGIGAQENMYLIAELAQAAGAAISGSKPVAESLGYIAKDRFVGMTGQKFSGSLYIACGISGATPHLEGIRTARTIVAINTDPAAPIFEACDYGIVADVAEFLPLLTDAFYSEFPSEPEYGIYQNGGINMKIKAVKFRKDGFYTQPMVFGGEESPDKYDPNVRYRGSLQNYLIDTGDEVILVDTGLPAGTPEEVPDETSMLFTGKDICSYMEAFAALGYKPEQVTKILLTHKHADHSGELKSFPNAKIYVNADEIGADELQGISNLVPVKFTDGAYYNFPESQKIAEGIYFIKAKGHTNGNSIIIVENGGLFYMLHGDITYVDEALYENKLSVVFDDLPAARETLDRVRDFVRNHPTVYCGTHTPQGYENLEAKRVMDLNNPVPTVLAEVDFSKNEGTGKYVCSVCGYVYDPAEHDGVAFEDLPDDWKCPRCKQPKEKFNKA